MKNKNIESMLAREGDALLESKKERVLASCGIESRAKVTRPVSARPRIARMLAVAAAVALLAVGMIAALPFMLAQNEIPNDTEGDATINNINTDITEDPENELHTCTRQEEHFCIDDIAMTESFGGNASYVNAWIRKPPSGYAFEKIEGEKKEGLLNSFFGVPELSVGSDATGYAEITQFYVIYEPSGEFFSLIMSFYFEEAGGRGVSVIIDPKAVFESHVNGEVPVTFINGCSVSKAVKYRVFSDATKKEPIKTMGDVSIRIQRNDAAILMRGQIQYSELTELVFDFLMNAKFDFKAFEK